MGDLRIMEAKTVPFSPTQCATLPFIPAHPAAFDPTFPLCSIQFLLFQGLLPDLTGSPLLEKKKKAKLQVMLLVPSETQIHL